MSTVFCVFVLTMIVLSGYALCYLIRKQGWAAPKFEQYYAFIATTAVGVLCTVLHFDEDKLISFRGGPYSYMLITFIFFSYLIISWRDIAEHFKSNSRLRKVFAVFMLVFFAGVGLWHLVKGLSMI